MKRLLQHVVILCLMLNCYRMVSASTRNTAKFYIQDNASYSFASYFGDHMVLQQAPRRALVWGYAPISDIGRTVTARVGSVCAASGEVTLGPVGGTAVWKVKLPAVSQHGPFTVTVSAGSVTLQLQDVLFGDVWLCSGQSNMQFTVSMMANASEELDDVVNYPHIRVFTVAKNYSHVPTYDLIGVEEPWSVPTRESIGHPAKTYFSAVCWIYGKYIFQKLGYPIGLVATDWGGTPIEAWSSPDALSQCGLSKTSLFHLGGPFETSRGLGGIFKTGPEDESVLWNSMIHPFLNMTIYGAVWYQGEANAERPDTYNCTFPAMISDWRQKFHDGSLGETDSTFAFGFVQLSANRNDSSIVKGFPDIRWHQTADVGYVPNYVMPNTFMAVAMDLPDFRSPWGSIHPRDKQDVAHRLMLSGLSVAYNTPGIKFQGPVITAFYIDIGYFTLGFDYDNGTSPIIVRNGHGFEMRTGLVFKEQAMILMLKNKMSEYQTHSPSNDRSFWDCSKLSLAGALYAVPGTTSQSAQRLTIGGIPSQSSTMTQVE